MEDATEEGTPGEGSVSRLIVVPRIRPDPSQAGFVKGQWLSNSVSAKGNMWSRLKYGVQTVTSNRNARDLSARRWLRAPATTEVAPHRGDINKVDDHTRPTPPRRLLPRGLDECSASRLV